MKGGIIAAGEGSRFKKAGINIPKPLIKVGDKTLLDWQITTLKSAGVESIAIIVNEQEGDQVLKYIHSKNYGLPLETIVRSTPSSMHSFLALGPLLADSRAIICTVDTISIGQEMKDFANFFRTQPDIELLLAYTDYVDDEKPLRIAIDQKQIVTALGPDADNSPYVTAGIYGVSPRVFNFEQEVLSLGMHKLRYFLGHLLKNHLISKGYLFNKAIDVDRPSDLEEAQNEVSVYLQGQ